MAQLINFSQFTADNGAVTRISELAFTTAWLTGELSTVFNVMTGQKDGKKIDFVDSIDDIATAGRGCDPEYQNITPKGFEKEWQMGDYSIPIEICADSWRNTIAKYALKTGTAMDDLTGTEIIEKVLMPLIDRAYTEALWRMAWFGDKNAASIGDSGKITNGVNVKLINMVDGLWKRIQAIVAANPEQKITIAANAQTTYATQKSALTPALALQNVEDVLSAADGRIFNNGGKLMMTNAFYQKLRKGYNQEYKATIPFENVSRGVSISEFDGIQILVFNEWDQSIKKFENSGTALNLPYRVVYANPDNLLIGTEDKNMVADMDLWFDKKDRKNRMYAASNIGTLVAEDDLIQVAL